MKLCEKYKVRSKEREREKVLGLKLKNGIVEKCERLVFSLLIANVVGVKFPCSTFVSSKKEQKFRKKKERKAKVKFHF